MLLLLGFLGFSEVVTMVEKKISTKVSNKKRMQTEPWWLSWLERQTHNNLSMLKVEGSNTGVAVYFRVNGNDSTTKNEFAIFFAS